MTEILLIRHAVNDWVKTGKLAGWTPGVHLNELGNAQAAALGERLADAKIHAVYSSPLERTMETAQAIVNHHEHLQVQPLENIGEVGYGDWQGEKLSKLRRFKLWENVQNNPIRVQFPNGETMRAAQARAVDCIEELYLSHPRQTIAVVSHSDVIKMVVAHYLGMHLDLFQRINISPASLTALHLDGGRPMLHTINDISHNPKQVPQSQDAKS